MGTLTADEKMKLKNLWSDHLNRILNNPYDVTLYKNRDILEALEHLRMVYLILTDKECLEAK